jgi:hypothetical protein
MNLISLTQTGHPPLTVSVSDEALTKIRAIIEGETWTEVPDSCIRHVWINPSGERVKVPSSFYSDCGVPMGEDGNDLTFSHTEINLHKWKEIKNKP